MIHKSQGLLSMALNMLMWNVLDMRTLRHEVQLTPVRASQVSATSCGNRRLLQGSSSDMRAEACE